MKQNSNSILRAAEQGIEGGQGGSGSNAAAVSTELAPVTIGTFLNPTNNRPTVSGLVLTRAQKDPSRITGMTLMKKRAFVEMAKRVAALPKGQVDADTGLVGEGVELTTKAAERRFDDYRRATYRELTKQQAQAMLAGKLAIDGVRFDAKGTARQFTIAKDGDIKRDKVHDSIETIAVNAGVPQDALAAFIEKYRKENPTVDVPATEKDESLANKGQPAIEAQTSEVRTPQAVPAA